MVAQDDTNKLSPTKDGERGEEHPRHGPDKELIRHLEKISLAVASKKPYRQFVGRNMSPSEFLNQFRPEWEDFSQRKTLCLIELNLTGTAAKWVKGASDTLFKTLEEFEEVFLEIFQEKRNRT